MLLFLLVAFMTSWCCYFPRSTVAFELLFFKMMTLCCYNVAEVLLDCREVLLMLS